MKMCAPLIYFMFIIFIKHTSGRNNPICENNVNLSRNCSAQISSDLSESCEMNHIAPHSAACANFSALKPTPRLGEVAIVPYHFQHTKINTYDYVVPNIVFTDIKWNRMKFRIEKVESQARHCRNVTLSDVVKISNETELYYNCYWSLTDGDLSSETHALDLESTDGHVVDRRQFLFFIPPYYALNPAYDVSIIEGKLWKPFIYVENLITTMILRIMPPPDQITITAYQIEVMKDDKDISEVVENTTVEGSDQEIKYDYKEATVAGSYYFVVTPFHEETKFRSAKSPKLFLDIPPDQTIYYVIIVLAIMVLGLTVYLIQRCCLRDLKVSDMPQPTKVLVIYPPASRVHAECVASFVECLSTYGIDAKYDGDVSKTEHGDPYFWAEDAIEQASVIMYIVGPEETAEIYHEDHPIHPLHNVDSILLAFLKAVRASQQKDVINVFFEHSTGPVPKETRHDKEFYLLRDWQKLIAYLSRNLLPKKQIMRSETGKLFMEDLTRAKKLLNDVSAV